MEEEKSLKKIKTNKKTEFVQKFKNRWLIKGINTIILIITLISIFLLINWGMKKWSPTAIDCTTSKDYSLTDESKERVKNIDKDINIYFVGYEESNDNYKLAKQYNKVNSKIKVELVDANSNQELAKKYNIEEGSATVIVECGSVSRTLNDYDLVSYDENYYTVNIAEQKITSAIVNVSSDAVPKVYFLSGYTEFELGKDLTYLEQYLKDEVLTYDTLNLLNKQKVPEDCNTLIIMTPNKDFDEVTTKAIIEYIHNGGNILWFNGVYEEDKNLENVNKILAEYGINKFEKGLIYETDVSKIFSYDTCFAPDIQESTILKDVKKSAGAILFAATKININEEKLEELKVTKNDLMLASEKAYFTSDLSGTENRKDDQEGTFVVGAELIKTISEKVEETEDTEAKEAVTSKLIIYGNDYFISDMTVQISSTSMPVVMLFNNKDVALNSIAYLVNNDQEITIRKSYSDSQTTFTPSIQEKTVISIIIFAIPVLVIILGIVVWVVRRRRH